MTVASAADISRTVDGDRPRSGFGDHRDVHHLVMRYPLFPFHAGILHQRDHGIAAAESEEPDPGKGQKKIRKNVHDADPLQINGSCRRICVRRSCARRTCAPLRGRDGDTGNPD